VETKVIANYTNQKSFVIPSAASSVTASVCEALGWIVASHAALRRPQGGGYRRAALDDG